MRGAFRQTHIRVLWRILVALVLILSALAALVSVAQAETTRIWETPVISIVWPHDAQGRSTGVIQSQLVNVSLWPSPMAPIPVPCAARPVNPFGQPITLFVAKNNEPSEPVDGGLSVLRTINGVRFPSLEFNNIRRI